MIPVIEMLIKSGYEQLYYYTNDNPALEMDFFVRDADYLIDWKSYPDIKYGIKLGYKNIGWNGKFYTFPYFLGFLASSNA